MSMFYRSCFMGLAPTPLDLTTFEGYIITIDYF